MNLIIFPKDDTIFFIA